MAASFTFRSQSHLISIGMLLCALHARYFTRKLMFAQTVTNLLEDDDNLLEDNDGESEENS